MATITPFNALRFDTGRIADLSAVLAPPYDVLSPEQAAERRGAHEHSIVRLTLPDGEGDQRYANAAALLDEWRGREVLRRDSGPGALYVYHQRCRGVTRRGFFARVRLAPYERREVLPHERTHAGPKVDRLALYRACAIQPEPLFFLYRDAGAGLLDQLDVHPSRRLLGKAVLSGAGVPEDVEEELWMVDDPDVLAAVCDGIGSRPLYVADGHHRYETGLAYEQEQVGQGADPETGDCHYVMALLVAADDPGLVVHATHRVVHGTGLDAASARDRIRGHLACEELGARLTGDALEERLLAEPGSTAIAAYADGVADLIRFEPLPPDAAAARKLDVSRLNDDVLLAALGIGEGGRPVASHVAYVQGASPAVERCRRGDAEVALLLKPTPAAAVLDVSDQGDVMPQKSTFFFPKITTGWVLNELGQLGTGSPV